MFTESLNGVSRKFKGHFKEVSTVFQESFMEITREFKLRLKGF